MFESIKAKLWENLRKKEVSLAMFYDSDGRILWHKGRAIVGKTIQEGDGFSKTFIKETMKARKLHIWIFLKGSSTALSRFIHLTLIGDSSKITRVISIGDLTA